MLGWFGYEPKADAYNAALDDLADYCDHQRERGEDYETDEYLRLNSRVIETEQHVPWWRR